MQKSLTRRETGLAVAVVTSLLLIVLLAAYALNLRTQNQRNSASIRESSVQITTDGAQANESANYTDTICAEYRKLYQAYTELSSQSPPANGIGYALPGAAKGEVDPCYQPDQP